QPTRQLQTRPRRTTRPRLSLRLHPFAVDLLDCRGVSRVGVAGYQHGPLAAGTVVDLLDGLRAVLRRAFAGEGQVAGDGIPGDASEAPGGADAEALADVVEDPDGLVRRQLGALEGGA